MGTRNTIIIRNDNKTVLSQYGQWDGYFSYMGKKICCFIQEKRLSEDYHLLDFKNKLNNLKQISEQKFNNIVADMDKMYKKYDLLMPLSLAIPTLSRDTGADILEIINDTINGYKIPIVLNNDFTCVEFVYIIDLDNKTLTCLTDHEVPNKLKVKVNNKYVNNLTITNGYKCFLLLTFEKLQKSNINTLVKKYKEI